MENRDLVVGRQDPLRRRYKTVPGEAWIEDRAETVGGAALDPFHGLVIPGSAEEGAWEVGIHRAVGGFHDQPNPGDILCAALSSCMDTTLRMLASRLRVPIVELAVRVTGDVDVRGTLAVSQEIAVGFQQL
ncbi:MAG TPA: OsmC family protein, partial [Candidatus Krumholzibacteria bacterium]|nr:OsmC family protein [Candidatus Krumholzibacteria bacterium]